MTLDEFRRRFVNTMYVHEYVYVCRECGACVEIDYRDLHITWHRKIDFLLGVTTDAES